MNPLNTKNASGSLSNGNLDATINDSSGGYSLGTLGASSGKWYWEATMVSSGDDQGHGICALPYSSSTRPYNTTSAFVYLRSGNKRTNGTNTSYGASYTSGDVVGVALDLDAGTLVFYKNGVSQGTAFTGLSGLFTAYFADDGAGTAHTATYNFGQRAFAYTAPSGFKALCTTNLPEPTIADGSTAMDVKLWSGDATAKSITGLGFSPDMVWYKERSSTSSHAIVDAVRGQTNAARVIYPDRTDAEVTANSTQSVTSLDSNGFTIGTDSSINESGQTYVAWTWDGGSSTVTNTSGSISSQVRANASAGFSIVTYTGTGSSASVGHGLGVAPAFYVTKRRDSSSFGNWTVYHSSIGTQFLELNGTGAAGTDANRWSSAATSTVFNIGSGGNVNVSGGTFVAYCFAPVAGYSAFGSYVGNNLADPDQPFIYTGFRPRWLLIRRSNVAAYWNILDTARDSYNVALKELYPNDPDLEQTVGGVRVDFVSNGFKIRVPQNKAAYNASGDTYIYCAFASHPFQTARAR